GPSLSARRAPTPHASPRQRTSLREPQRRGALAAVAVGSGTWRGRGSWSQATGVAPRATTLVRQPPAGRGRRPALRPGHAAPRRYLDDADLHAPADRGAQGDVPGVPPEGPSVSRRAQAYPQVMPTAAELVDGAIVSVPPRLGAGDAMRLARRRGGDVL